MIDITGSSDALGPTPMAVEGPARDEPFFLRGRRVRAQGNEHGGLQAVASGEATMMGGCASTAPPAGHVRLDPGLVTRSWGDGGAERTWTALALPLLVWEYDGPQYATLTWRTPVGPGATIDRSDDGGWAVSHGNGRRVRFVARAGTLAAQLVDGAVQFAFPYSSGARLVALVAEGDADDRRTMDHFTRRGVAGLASQRAQHAVHLRQLGATLRTPDAGIDRAFGWAAFLCDAADGDEASGDAADSQAAMHVARGLLAAGLRDGVRAEARALRRRGTPSAWREALLRRWVGVDTDADCSAADGHTVGFLARLREAAALLDSRSARLLGPDSHRAATVLVDGVQGLFGIRPDGANEALTLEPALPDAWPAMALDRIRVGSAVLDVEVRRRPSATVVALRLRSGGPSIITVGLPDAAVTQVDLDDVLLPAPRARFEARHEHKLVFRHDE